MSYVIIRYQFIHFMRFKSDFPRYSTSVSDPQCKPLLSSWPLNWIILEGKPLIKEQKTPNGNIILYFVLYPTTWTIWDAWYVGLMLFIPSWPEMGSAAVIIWYPLQRAHSFHGTMRKDWFLTLHGCKAYRNNLDTCLNGWTRAHLLEEYESIFAFMLLSILI